jgi:hypothetical protein
MHHSNKEKERPKRRRITDKVAVIRQINKCKRSVSVIFLMITDDDYDDNDEDDMYDDALINLITYVPSFRLDMYLRDHCGLNLLFLNVFNIQACVSFSNGRGYVVLQ